MASVTGSCVAADMSCRDPDLGMEAGGNTSSHCLALVPIQVANLLRNSNLRATVIIPLIPFRDMHGGERDQHVQQHWAT